MFFFFLPTEAATIPIAMMAYRSDRRGVKPITDVALRGLFRVWHPAREFSIMARSPKELLLRGRRYVCSLTRLSRLAMDPQLRGN